MSISHLPVALLLAALAACDGDSEADPELRLASSVAEGGARLVAGRDTIVFRRATDTEAFSRLYNLDVLPPFPITVSGGAVQVEGYFVAPYSGGRGLEGRVTRSEGAADVTIGLKKLEGGVVADEPELWFYTAEVTSVLPGERLRVVHIEDLLHLHDYYQGEGSIQTVVLDVVVPARVGP